MNKELTIIVLLLIILAIVWVKKHKADKPPVEQNIVQEDLITPFEVQQEPQVDSITTSMPKCLSYEEIINQLKTWNKEAADLTELGTYGKTSQGKDNYYLKVTNKFSKSVKKKVMITGCIHGDKPLAACMTMSYIGNILENYKDEQIANILATREIYFVPVVSPDSY